MNSDPRHGQGSAHGAQPGADYQLAILAYHKIGAPPKGGRMTWFYTPEDAFAAHLRQLRAAGWEIIDLATMLRMLDDPGAGPTRAAMLTFDDGYRSMLYTALPHLQRHDVPAVLFVPTDFIGRTNAFDHGIEPDEPICTLDELRMLEREGVSVQSHGVSHAQFSKLGAADQLNELTVSKTILEEGLGHRVEIFSYPYGDQGPDERAAEALLTRAGYRAGCLYGGGIVSLPSSSPARLARLPIGSDPLLPRVLLPAAGSDEDQVLQAR